MPPHSIPTAEFKLLDQARLGYWRAVKKGNPKRIESALKAWRDLLHIPRTKGKKNGRPHNTGKQN